MLEFDRVLFYLLLLIVCGSFARRPGALGAVLRWTALGMVLVCAAGLATRVLPGTFHASASVAPQRLSWPLTYWNALGILSGICLTLLTHLTVSQDERPAVRVAAAGALPLVAVTLLFTFSRGGIAATLLALVAYVVLALPRGLLVGLITAGLPAAVATAKAYNADQLAQADYATAAGQAEGRQVLAVLVACMVAAVALRAVGLLADRRIEAIRLPDRWRRPVLGTAVAVAVVALVAVAIAVDLPGRVGDARRSFTQGSLLTVTTDTRQRLTQLGNNGRVDNWRVARDSFQAHPWDGTGAGTYRLDWERDRPVAFQVVNAHSLYLEVLAELGVPGMALLASLSARSCSPASSVCEAPSAARTPRSSRPGSACSCTRAWTGTGRCPRVFCWFVVAGAVAAASHERERAASLGRVATDRHRARLSAARGDALHHRRIGGTARGLDPGAAARRLPIGGRPGDRQPRSSARASRALRGARLLRCARRPVRAVGLGDAPGRASATPATGSTPTASRSCRGWPASTLARRPRGLAR